MYVIFGIFRFKKKYVYYKGILCSEKFVDEKCKYILFIYKEEKWFMLRFINEIIVKKIF